MKKVYYGKAVYNKKEIQAVVNVLKNNSLSLVDGKNVKKLEKIVSKNVSQRWVQLVFLHLKDGLDFEVPRMHSACPN